MTRDRAAGDGGRSRRACTTKDACPAKKCGKDVTAFAATMQPNRCGVQVGSSRHASKCRNAAAQALVTSRKGERADECELEPVAAARRDSKGHIDKSL